MDRKIIVEKILLPKCEICGIESANKIRKNVRFAEFRIFLEKNLWVCDKHFHKFQDEHSGVEIKKTYDFSKNPLPMQSDFMIDNRKSAWESFRDFGVENYSVRQNPDILEGIKYLNLWIETDLVNKKENTFEIVLYSQKIKLVLLPLGEKFLIGYTVLGKLICKIDNTTREILMYKQ